MPACPNCGQDNPDVAQLCMICGTPLRAYSTAPQEARKTVTIVFCDLVGSTALGERYEEAVDSRSGRRAGIYKFHYDGRDPGKPGSKAKHVASVSHRFYTRLVRSYDRNGYSLKVRRITKRQLNRGANAVADVAAAIKAASKRIGGGGGGGSNCSPAYPDVCIPPPPPDLNCDDVRYENFRVVKHPDPHGFDTDEDGVGCET